MKRHGLFPAVVILLALLWALAGCAAIRTDPPDRVAAETQIRSRIASIREAILARSAEGIVHWATGDWSFTGADGVKFDRAGYLARTTALFARVPAIESLDTQVDRLEIHGDSADIEITQTMVRREIDPATKAETRVWLRYREKHRWVAVARDWRVQAVAFIGQPERKNIP